MNIQNDADRNDAVENFEQHKNVPDTSSARSKDGVQNYRTTELQNAQKNEEQLTSKEECLNYSQPIDVSQKIIPDSPLDNSDHTIMVEARPTSHLEEHRHFRTRGRRKSKVRKKRGGWPTTSGIAHIDFNHLRHSIGMLERIGFPLRHFISIRPPAEIQGHAARKKYCRGKIESLRRRFNRKGHQFIGLGIFEQDVGGLLHLHLALYTTGQSIKLLKNIDNSDVFHIRPFDQKGIGYLLKSRLPTYPDRERELSRAFPRRKNEKFSGKRWCWTKDAKGILPNEGQRHPQKDAPSEIRLKIILSQTKLQHEAS